MYTLENHLITPPHINGSVSCKIGVTTFVADKFAENRTGGMTYHCSVVSRFSMNKEGV